jgi:hypothetical protein
MSPRFAANTGMGADVSPALPTRGDALPRTPVEQLASDDPQRVRAPERATRSANGSGCCQSETTCESPARQSPHARRRRSESLLPFAAGGPGPLTEDRQKPSGRQFGACELGRQPRLDGRHGTRNTVPSRALTEAVEHAHCRPQRHSSMGLGLRRPELPEFPQGRVPVLAHSTART